VKKAEKTRVQPSFEKKHKKSAVGEQHEKRPPQYLSKMSVRRKLGHPTKCEEGIIGGRHSKRFCGQEKGGERGGEINTTKGKGRREMLLNKWPEKKWLKARVIKSGKDRKKTEEVGGMTKVFTRSREPNWGGGKSGEDRVKRFIS